MLKLLFALKQINHYSLNKYINGIQILFKVNRNINSIIYFIES